MSRHHNRKAARRPGQSPPAKMPGPFRPAQPSAKPAERRDETAEQPGLGEASLALQAARRAVCQAPGNPQHWAALMRGADAAGQVEVKLAALHRLIRLAPDDFAPHVMLGRTYEALSRFDLAIPQFCRAIELAPHDPVARDQLAAAFRSLRRFDDALALARTTLALVPADMAALIQYAVTLQSARRPGADVWYRRAQDSAAEHVPLIDWNRSLALLAAGDLGRGWAKYEAGFAAGKRTPHRDRLGAPRWHGEDLSARTIMTWREQGVGDELVFASCFPDLIDQAGRCIIECEPRLVPLFRRSFPAAEVRADTERAEDEPADFDCHVPAGSLPGFFRPTPDSFPSRQAYLTPDPARVAFWRERFEALGPGLKVGICWRGRLRTQSRSALYAQLDEWEAILRLAGIVFLNFQYGDPEPEIAAAEARFGCRIHRWSDIDLMNDFDDAAAFGRALDLAIVADTAGGALMGALGVPTWRYVTRGDFMSLGTDGFPWMPSMRVYFREIDELWPPVIARIADDLQRRTASPAGRWLPPPALPDAPPYEPPLVYLAHTAMEFQRQGRLTEAAALYRKILSHTPDEAHCLQLLGSLTLRAGDTVRAAMLLTRAVCVWPDYVAARVQLGVAVRRQGAAAAATAHFSAALVYDPQHPEALANLGEALAVLGRQGQALIAFRRATQIRPDIPELETNLGNLQAATGDLPGAAARQRRAIALNPAYVDAYLNYAAALAEMRDLDAAEALYARALHLRPGQPAILARLQELRQRKHTGPADANADVATILSQAVEQHRAGNWQVARDAYRQVLKIDPQQADALHLLGVIALQRGEAAAAEAHLAAALCLDPAFSQALSNLGRVFQAAGFAQDAERSYRRAVRLEPHAFDATVHLAATRFSNGDGKAAAALLRRALILAPGHAAVWNRLGEAAASLGESDAAAAAWQRARQIVGPQASPR